MARHAVLRAHQFPRNRSHMSHHGRGDTRERRIGSRVQAHRHRRHCFSYRYFLQKFAGGRPINKMPLHQGQQVAIGEQCHDTQAALALNNRNRIDASNALRDFWKKAKSSDPLRTSASTGAP